MTVSDILSQTYVPPVVQLFDHHKAVNHDGHVMSLLSVQLTELADRVFIGCSMNHCLGDGTSYWNFLNSWSEIFRAESTSSTLISLQPVLNRWIPEGHGPIFSLRFARPEEFEAPELRERIFCFSAESGAKLKAKANAAAEPSPEQATSCVLAACNRWRAVVPPVPQSYFGNAIHALKASAGDLLGNGLGRAARRVHRAVAEHGDAAVREFVEGWVRSPWAYQIGLFFESTSLMIRSSPRFDKYGSKFGMGKFVALRSGYANKFDGKVSCYPGREGRGSIDLETCLKPDTMRALESDSEFMEAAGLVHNEF